MKITQLFASGALLLTLGVHGCKSKETSRVFSFDGVDINYSQQGNGEPALVFVHGWSCDGSFWKYQVPYFARNHKVVTIDLGGHGQSGLGREEWTIESYGKDVAAVVNKLGLKKIILIGHSMGGPVTVEAARQIPEKVIALVGADTFHDIETGYSKEMFAEILVKLKADFATEAKDFVHQIFPADADPNLVEWVAKKISSANPEVAIRSTEKLGDYDLKKAVKDVNVPMYSINSDLWPTNCQANNKYVKSFEVKLMPGVGHFVMLEDAAKFNGYLDEIIEEADSQE